jgi:hypothetical protein
MGSKFRCIRSTLIESVSSSDKCFECFAETGLKFPLNARFSTRSRCQYHEEAGVNRGATFLSSRKFSRVFHLPILQVQRLDFFDTAILFKLRYFFLRLMRVLLPFPSFCGGR